MHEAALAALWAAWDECTCAGAALLATFLSELRVFAWLLGVRVRSRQSSPFSKARFSRLEEARHSSAAGQVQEGISLLITGVSLPTQRTHRKRT